jgi:hypothetical protein
MITENTIYRVVRIIDGTWIKEEFTNDNVIPAMEIRGYEMTGNYSNPRTREEMQGAPTFAGLLGPMYDGDAIRYETQEVYNALSM